MVELVHVKWLHLTIKKQNLKILDRCTYSRDECVVCLKER